MKLSFSFWSEELRVAGFGDQGVGFSVWSSGLWGLRHVFCLYGIYGVEVTSRLRLKASWLARGLNIRSLERGLFGWAGAARAFAFEFGGF